MQAVPAQLDAMVERGEISLEAATIYAEAADGALPSLLENSGRTHNTAPTRFVEADGTRFAYRRFGKPMGTPIVLLQHFMGNLDNYDPAITDALAKDREVILTDNAGVGLGEGPASETVAGMARDAASLIDALGLEQVDLFGFSMGGFVAQQIAVDHPELVRRLVLVGTGPRGGEGGLEYLKGIPHPALVINGSNDVVVSANSYILQQNLPNAELILFPDSNHGSHFQFTELFNRYVTDFVDR
jgi:pimeloyl-ACP methyl ester carboxylesterase